MLRKEALLLKAGVQKPLVSVLVSASCNYEYMVNVWLSCSYTIKTYSTDELFSGVAVNIPADATLYLGYSMKSGYKLSYEVREYRYTGASKGGLWDGKSSEYSVKMGVYPLNDH